MGYLVTDFAEVYLSLKPNERLGALSSVLGEYVCVCVCRVQIVIYIRKINTEAFASEYTRNTSDHPKARAFVNLCDVCMFGVKVKAKNKLFQFLVCRLFYGMCTISLH